MYQWRVCTNGEIRSRIYIFGYGMTVLSIKYMTAMFKIQAQRQTRGLRRKPRPQHALEMALNLKWRIWLLQVFLLLWCELLSAHRQSVIDPLDAAETNDGSCHSLHHPCQCNLGHSPPLFLREFFYSIDNFFRLLSDFTAASRPGSRSTNTQWTSELAFGKGSPLNNRDNEYCDAE